MHRSTQRVLPKIKLVFEKFDLYTRLYTIYSPRHTFTRYSIIYRNKYSYCEEKVKNKNRRYKKEKVRVIWIKQTTVNTLLSPTFAWLTFLNYTKSLQFFSFISFFYSHLFFLVNYTIYFCRVRFNRYVTIPFASSHSRFSIYIFFSLWFVLAFGLFIFNFYCFSFLRLISAIQIRFSFHFIFFSWFLDVRLRLPIFLFIFLQLNTSLFYLIFLFFSSLSFITFFLRHFFFLHLVLFFLLCRILFSFRFFPAFVLLVSFLHCALSSFTTYFFSLFSFLLFFNYVFLFFSLSLSSWLLLSPQSLSYLSFSLSLFSLYLCASLSPFFHVFPTIVPIVVFFFFFWSRFPPSDSFD